MNVADGERMDEVAGNDTVGAGAGTGIVAAAGAVGFAFEAGNCAEVDGSSQAMDCGDGGCEVAVGADVAVEVDVDVEVDVGVDG